MNIHADQDLMEQVWLNLITNAIKYTSSKGQVTIGMKLEITDIVVRIQDTGKGIPEGAIPKLFDRFYKVDKARSSSTNGSGLGLSIAKRILDIHHFPIEIISEQGIGSIFIVRIPNRNNTLEGLS
ncbi:cell wall metabolism sensor histidine kinase WalK [Bacillus sp. JCM 19034]|uniref:sensor histidine kinase n=1 Tax=Bacillus sp. JCM 19034 TaxID=1481928 RepID=UPI000782C71B|nr:ATP-binding protein [Bacillus sp. JCM 19034]